MHKRYNLKVSLYIYKIDFLKELGSTFKEDFLDNADWMKLGFHAGQIDNLKTDDEILAKKYYQYFIQNILYIVGGSSKIFDRVPRLNYFAGSKQALLTLHNSPNGCIGFLCADDSRLSYYIQEDEYEILRRERIYYDKISSLYFFPTDMRLDWFVEGFSSVNKYCKPVKSTPYEELIYRTKEGKKLNNLIIFTHEWQYYSSKYEIKEEMIKRIADVGQFALDYNYKFDFPQNHILDIK